MRPMRELEKKQKEILRRINVVEEIQPTASYPILSIILGHSDEEFQSALGGCGLKFKQFLKEIDRAHPALASIYDGQLVSEARLL